MSDIECILCNHNGVNLQGIVSAKVLKAAWQDLFEIDVHGDFDGLDDVSMCECQQCGLVFFSPPVAGTERFYAALQRYDWYYLANKWEFDSALSDLKPGERVLEVGCGWGEFVREAQVRGLLIEGIELNTEAVRAAEAKGLPVKKEELYTLSRAQPEVYDSVCSFQVLEHVPNPYSFITACLNLLKVGGKLIVSVPNNDSFIHHDQDGWLNQPPHHVSRWSKVPLDYLSGLLPVKLLRLAYEPLAEYHLDWYVSVQQNRFSERNRFGRLAQKSLGLLFDNVVVPSGLYRRIRGHTIYACFQKIE